MFPVPGNARVLCWIFALCFSIVPTVNGEELRLSSEEERQASVISSQRHMFIFKWQSPLATIGHIIQVTLL